MGREQDEPQSQTTEEALAVSRGRPDQLVFPVLRLLWHKMFDDRILGMAAEAGFWAIVSLPSSLLAVFGALGYFRGLITPSGVDHIRNDVLRAARDILTPGTVNSDVAPILNQILGRGQFELVSIGFVISLWSGSTAINDYLNTITVAYGMRGLRGAVRSRIVALGLYLCAVVVGIIMLPLLALGPDALVGLFSSHLRPQVTTFIHAAYFPVVAAGSVAVLAVFYKACLPVAVRYRRNLPGAFVAMVLWVVLSLGVRAYLTSSFRAKSAFGSLGAPIAVLLFFYVTALAVLLGAELNSAIDAVWPVTSTADARALSRRKAADTAARRGSTAAVTGVVRDITPERGWRSSRDHGNQ